MENLNTTGIKLKKINVSDYSRMVEDLNHNFSILLSSPIFKGIPGIPGINGVGNSGERGSRWIWAIWDEFRTAYDLSNPNQVSLIFINGQLSDDIVKLLRVLNTDNLIANDNIVLPNGNIISFDLSLGKFKDSGTSFAQAQGLTESRVTQMINSAIEGINEGSIVYELFKAYAKNFPDASTGGNNNQVNPDSVLDIDVPSGKIGYLMDKHKFVAMTIANMNTVQDTATFIFGAAELYHDLIQKTQNSVGKTTNEYAPGVNDSTTLAILQDNYKNGVIIGHKNATSMRDFSRIWRDEDALHLTSNYSVYDNEFGEIVIKRDVITLKPNKNDNNAKVVVDSNFEVVNKAKFFEDIIHEAFNVNKNNFKTEIGIKQSEMPLGKTYVTDFLESPLFSSITNMTFLGTDAQGKVKGSGFTVSTTVNSGSTHVQLPTSASVFGAINDVLTSVNGQIASINANIQNLNNNVSTLQRDSLLFRNIQALPNDTSAQGIYRLSSTISPNGQSGYVINLVDTSNSTRSQIAVTATDILFRSSTGSINSVPWITVSNKADLLQLRQEVTARLNGHDIDIATLSNNISNNYTTLNNKIDGVNGNLTNKINTDVSNAITTLRGETISAIKGISVSGGLIKTEVGNSINIAHGNFPTNIIEETTPSRLITSMNTNNGHVTEIKWMPFSNISELRYGMVIDLIAFYIPPNNQFEWWRSNIGKNTYDGVYANYFDINGRGKSNAVAYLKDGSNVVLDISKFTLCDGRNGTPNLTGVTMIGAGSIAGVTSDGRKIEADLPITINSYFIPSTDVKKVDPYSNFMGTYGTSFRMLTIEQMPQHTHSMSYKGETAQGGGSSRISLAPDSNGGSYKYEKTSSQAGGNTPVSSMQTSFAVWKIMFTG